MTKFKRKLVPGSYLTAADMLSVLSQQQLKAAALGGQVLLLTQPPLAWLLDSCCMGRPAKQAGVEEAAFTEDALEEGAEQQQGNSSNSDGGGRVGGDSRPNKMAGSGMYEASGRAVATAVLGISGLNTASEAVWQQYREHQQQQLAQQLRRGARVSNRKAAAVAAAVSVQVGEGPDASESQELCLWHLSHQEAVFLSHVLSCCQVFAAGDKTTTVSAAITGKGTQQDGGADSGPGELVGSGAHVQQQQQQQQQQDFAGLGDIYLQQQQQQQQQEQQQPISAQPEEEQPGRAPPSLLEGDALWQWCCENTTGGAAVFAPQYAAYHHLRSLGWLPLPGLSYGADYVVYQLHPELAHSDFVVTVMVEAGARCSAGSSSSGLRGSTESLAAADTQQQQQQQQQQPSSTQLAWLDACIMQRLARQVLKEMLLLYVVVPPGLSLLRFDCVHGMHVREVLVHRWVPSEHRDT